MRPLRSFDEFRAAVLSDVSERVKKTSGTPPPQFVIEDADGTLRFYGPIFASEQEKDRAPDVMREWIQEFRPTRLAFVMEAFSIDRPTEEDHRSFLRENLRAVHLVSVWFFRRGSGDSEDWSAPVVAGNDVGISLGEWRAIDEADNIKNGFLWDPVAEAMAKRGDQ